MNIGDFDTQFNRLTGHFHLPADASREKVGVDWYQAVQGYELAVFEHSVTHIIRTAQDRFWPPLGLLLQLCRGRASSSTTAGKCATCHGSSWLEGLPFIANGMVYSNAVVRCPDCATPPPSYTAPSHRSSLTAIEYREWSERKTPVDYMPEACKAKPWADASKAQHKAEMRSMFARLRIKLFGSTKDAA